jgi:glycosyltransferase involved in cell wall biosynthesis
MTEMLLPHWSVAVIVPARNEQKRIRRCLESLLLAIDATNVQQSAIVVAADRCDDDTVANARDVLGTRGSVIEIDHGSPGASRRAGADRALDLLRSIPRNRLWLANTDADSYVPRDWIARQLDFATRGATAVAGIVEVDSFGRYGEQGRAVFRRHYDLHADGTHSHVHGANMGVRADVYLDAGGWRDLAAGEDHCLWRRVRERGWRVESSVASIVMTSGRLRGRAHGGFADTLRMQLQTAAHVEPEPGAATP